MIIYKATNKENGKMYIGLTSQSLSKRKQQHKSIALKGESQTRFHRAIRKYGFDSFDWEIICEANNKEELCELESYWIKKLRTHEIGYNCNFGGTGSCEQPSCEKHYRASLTNEQVLKIKELLLENVLTIQEIANLFNVSKGVISDINIGKTYKDIIGKAPCYIRKSKIGRLTKKEREEVKELVRLGVRNKIICEKYNISSSMVTKYKKQLKGDGWNG